MKRITFNLIGAGRLGKTLAVALTHNNVAELLSLYNPSLTSSQKVTQQLGTGKAIASLAELQPADMLWITAPDDQTSLIVHELVEKSSIRPGTIVVHCSGVLGSDILAPLAQLGCHTASLHPLKAFAKDDINPMAFQGCYCAIEGSPQAITTLSNLFERLGAKLTAINPSKKAVYHAAAVISSNYLVTLAAEGIKLLEEAGIETDTAFAITQQLMQGSLQNIGKTRSPRQALTGPLVRGDKKTIQCHLENLNDPITKQLYCAAALATLPLTLLDETQRHEIEALLRQEH